MTTKLLFEFLVVIFHLKHSI